MGERASRFLCASLLSAFCASGAGGAGFGFEGSPLSLSVFLDRDAVHPGDVFKIAVLLKVEPSWHAYANPKGPGTGKPTVVRGKDTEYFRFRPARYLAGKRISQEEIGPGDWVYAYEGEVPVFCEVEVAESCPEGTYSLEIEVDALLCKQSCLPVNETVRASVAVRPRGTPATPLHSDLFARFNEAKPAKPAAGAPPEITPAQVGEAAVDLSRYQGRVVGTEVRGLLLALILGFVAGIILNVMPCVLPVVSIKVMSLVAQAHEERGRVFRLGLAFAAGILVVFLILAALVALAGHAWGEHFQSETFVVIMTGVVFVFSLGLFDVYVIVVPAGGSSTEIREGYVGSFFKGILTTFLATPCSGPLLGATLAWALTQTWPVVFTVFTAVGCGMAAPYLVLSTFPGLLRFVPKPGPWMETFKHCMGFVLLGTVVYLLSLLREELLVPALAWCLILGFGAYLWGRYGHGAVPVVKRWVVRGAVVVLAACGAYVCFRSPAEPIKWEPFSFEALARYSGQGGGRPKNVVVKFTAKWCPNCKFVERVVLESAAVRTALAKKGTVFLKADITHASADDPARKMLFQLGSRSIPFLAVFPADDHYRPYVLRDVYLWGDVLSVAEKLPDVSEEEEGRGRG